MLFLQNLFQPFSLPLTLFWIHNKTGPACFFDLSAFQAVKL